MGESLPRWLMNCARLSVAAAALIGGDGFVFAQASDSSFPFDHELRLEATPKRGSKRIPVLQVSADGNLDIDLWCASGKGQVVFADSTIAIVPMSMRDNQCSPDQLKDDEELLTDLTEMKTWRLQGDVVVLTGNKTLRFRVATN